MAEAQAASWRARRARAPLEINRRLSGDDGSTTISARAVIGMASLKYYGGRVVPVGEKSSALAGALEK